MPADKGLTRKSRDFLQNQIILTAQLFTRVEASSGIVLLFAAVVAIVWANSPWQDAYVDLRDTSINIETAIFHLDLSLQQWVNDGLMTIFFFLMGLEIKREVVHGELSSLRRAMLPAMAALGGMIAPALIYTAFNIGGGEAGGWGVPLATDIAFALGVLALLGSRIPLSVRVFLLALAIADDIGAILVIAIFYSSEISLSALGISALILAVAFAINRSGVRTVNIYIALGAALWIAVHESGVHATIAGVVLGLLTPAGHHYNPETFAESAEDLSARYRIAKEAGATDVQESLLEQMEDLAKGTETPLVRLERSLVHWVSFSIVPLFALLNAGILLSGDSISDALRSPVSRGVLLGLVIGKPAGIFLFTLLSVKLKLCDIPSGASWRQIFGVALLSGIGFTVSLLISELSFDQPAVVDEAKLGVLVASIVAGIAGFVFLFLSSQPPAAEKEITG
jgi:NhaA family Na+:H+ antiporter